MKLKKNIFIISSIMFALLATLIVGSLFPSYGFLTSAASKEIQVVSNEINIEAYDSDNKLNNTGFYDPNSLFDGTPYTQYLWAGVDHFKVSPNVTGYADGKYEYYYEIEYNQVRPSTDNPFINDDIRIIKNAFKGEVTNPNKILPFNFFVDPAMDGNIYEQLINNVSKKEARTWGDWGTYRFTLFLNGNTKYSMFYYLEPNKITAAPVIDQAISSSVSSMNNAYTFTISNYNFVDGNQIKWFVFGEGNDGKLYSLTKDDADKSSTDYKNYLWATVNRNGSQFYFDSKGIAGQWEVYCIVYDQNNSEVELFSTRNETFKITTGKKISTNFIIWILVGAGVVLLGVVTFIIVKTTKKEKVW